MRIDPVLDIVDNLDDLDLDIVNNLRTFGFNVSGLDFAIHNNLKSHITATYFILLNKKKSSNCSIISHGNTSNNEIIIKDDEVFKNREPVKPLVIIREKFKKELREYASPPRNTKYVKQSEKPPAITSIFRSISPYSNNSRFKNSIESKKTSKIQKMPALN